MADVVVAVEAVFLPRLPSICRAKHSGGTSSITKYRHTIARTDDIEIFWSLIPHIQCSHIHFGPFQRVKSILCCLSLSIFVAWDFPLRRIGIYHYSLLSCDTWNMHISPITFFSLHRLAWAMSQRRIDLRYLLALHISTTKRCKRWIELMCASNKWKMTESIRKKKNMMLSLLSFFSRFEMNTSLMTESSIVQCTSKTKLLTCFYSRFG